jgi:hypothetical protein
METLTRLLVTPLLVTPMLKRRNNRNIGLGISRIQWLSILFVILAVDAASAQFLVEVVRLFIYK